MKFLRLTRLNDYCIKNFYLKNEGLSDKSYEEQKSILDHNAFEWSDYWSHGLKPLGYEPLDVISNVDPLQRAWSKENMPAKASSMPLDDIALAQVKKFAPEIIWFEDNSTQLLKRIRSEIRSVRLVLGWVGSAIPRTQIWSLMDLVFSCAQESVDTLQKEGYPALQLHHGFDPRINGRLTRREKKIGLSFIGQLIRTDQFHLHRDQLLEKLASSIEISIFSTSAYFGWKETGTAIVMRICYDFLKAMKLAGFPSKVLEHVPIIGEAAKWPFRPVLPVNPRLKPFMKPPVFGLEMFQTLRDSDMTLNIHADSSPHYASNMRLFETTGVGTCLITDWKKNLHQLFEPDKEIVVYKSADECVEKVKWLRDHPKEREEIGLAGQKRTLEDHTFARRAEQLHDVIRERLTK